MKATGWLLCVVALLCASCTPLHASILGLQKEHAAHFSAAKDAGVFRCLDGSATVPFSAVNDEICDCPDGSDEPGTSACSLFRGGAVLQLPPAWKFQCTNAGHFSQAFPHSRVNDGICDCCDGSDETGSLTECPNRCVEETGRLAQKQEVEQERMKTASENKALMRAAALQRRDDAAKAAALQEAEHAELLASLPALRERNAAALEAQRVRLAELQVKWEAWEAGREEREAAEDAPSCVRWRQTGNCVATGPRESELDQPCSSKIASGHSGYCECTAFPEESADHDEGEWEESTRIVTYNFSCGHPELRCSRVCAQRGSTDDIPAEEEPQNPADFSLPEAREAGEALARHENRLAEVAKSKEKLQKLLSSPTVTTEELLRTLENTEFTIKFHEYTYALSMFNAVHQRNEWEKDGGTLLGSWKSFAENTYAMWAKDEYDLSHMIYDNGARCWNGAVRAVEVHVVCGPENRLAQVEEPSLCSYRFGFETPAVCDD
ncbi:Glucosidase II beta subunit-like/Glucosidase II beta subunit-like protein [Novymonas esmeraldas]|uniref:Glucosidase 2 subunit beta n=1 Tax=Novymonas esmeraldas TaxID=1808958 RepID=A0AAW0F3V1_9TRYP